jgi:hypothetical protein
MKLCASKVTRIPTMWISRLPLGSPGTKSHLDVTLVERHTEYTIKGEGGGFPQVWAVVCLVSPSCPWLVLTPKVLQLHTNHFVLVLCMSMWIIEACHFFLVPSQNSNTPLYPSKMLRARKRASTSCSSVVFSLGLSFESLKELGARHMDCPLEFVSSFHKIQIKHLYHDGIHFAFLHVIFQCLISHSNIILCIYHFHMSLTHYWI